MSKEIGKGKTLLILFLPAILNILIGFCIATVVAMDAIQRGVPPERIGLEVQKAMFTFSFYWSFIQVGVGLYVIKLLGGWSEVKEVYSRDDLLERPLRSIDLIVGLVVLTLAIIWGMQFISAMLFCGSWEVYMQRWQEIVAGIPWIAKLYYVAIAPFTAGIFEEIIWRHFGISQLEKFYSLNKAIIIQAVAFGFWHGISLHTIATMLIGLVYGYVYAKRRRLLLLSTAHVLVDIIGFGMVFLR